ncbi:glycosyltransferase family 2 protein [Palleronia sp. LCG004]|uniref:glycosyltransferase family 2 protein n=1 Tax=Palleronia sp. LCG004 TaxID=3079304 RepID=UPI002943DF83|nr:glycosyltransferase [Palleronia sp. LCG004]WOI58397.1 glycosyltransferase [Palleronia sp. LCG004]
MMSRPRIGAVAIGRNEGARLLASLASLKDQADRVVYVDSGSTDGSVSAARERGVEVVELDLSLPFTAARARNAGRERLREILPDADLVQFVDGDCELRPDWIAKATARLAEEPALAIVCGRRRERHPEASLWNRLVDREWDTPVGPARACGGDALMRLSAFDAAEGFDPTLIAGEEPELCVRLRKAGWRIERIDAEMTLHDADMTRMGQWWMRARRAGHAYAEGAAMHGAPPERHKVAELRRALVWALAIPLAVLILTLAVSPWALLLLLIYPTQILRLRLHGEDWIPAFLLTLGKFPELQGASDYALRRLTRRGTKLIEYK